MYYLLDRGFPFYAVLTAAEAEALYAAAPAELSGDVAGGFEYAVLLENGYGRRVALRTRVHPIPPDQLAEVVRRFGWLAELPAELTACA